MSGIPVIGYDFRSGNPFYEVPVILGEGGGIVVNTIDDARAAVSRLLHDPEEAARVSRGGHERAIALFGSDKIGSQWDALIRSLA